MYSVLFLTHKAMKNKKKNRIVPLAEVSRETSSVTKGETDHADPDTRNHGHTAAPSDVSRAAMATASNVDTR